MSNAFEKSACPLKDKLDNFPLYVQRHRMARYFARYELFKLQQHIKGSIIECGVHHGGGLLFWSKLSAALEPYALDRRIFGFDTFSGFPSIDSADSSQETNEAAREGGFDTGYDVFSELNQAITEFDGDRPLNQFQKVFLVRGDAADTIPAFVEEHPYILVSLLFLDFDLYEPTKVALKHFLPRMSKGSVLVFDELNNSAWPGETTACLEELDIRGHEIRRFSFDPNIAYIVL